MIATTAFSEMNSMLNNLPREYLTYKCTSDNKALTRNIKNLTIPQVEELKKKLDQELQQFETLYQKHANIDNQCMDVIRSELAIICADRKIKDISTILQGRFQKAIKDTSSCFSAVSDYGPNLKSVKGRELYNFIMQYHQHKCIYTNHFKQCKGDTSKEVLRLQDILNHHNSCRFSSFSFEKEEEDRIATPVEKKEEDRFKDLKQQIQSLELEEEEW